MMWVWTLIRYQQGMDNLCFFFMSDYPSALLNGREVILLEGSVEGDRLMVLDDEPQRMVPSSSHSSGLLDADFSAIWVPEVNRDEFDEDGTDEFCNDFSNCLSPEPPWHAGNLLVETNCEISANSEDEFFAIDNSPPLSLHRGWSPDMFASQEKFDNSCTRMTQSTDPKFSEVKAALTSLSIFLRAFQTFLDPWNRGVVLNSPTSSCKSLVQSGDNHLNGTTVKTYNVTSKLDD